MFKVRMASEEQSWGPGLAECSFEQFEVTSCTCHCLSEVVTINT